MAHIYGRRFARARCTAARLHGLLPSTARSSTPASAQAPLWLCTWPSWARPCRHLQLRRRHACESNHSGLQQVRFLRKLMLGVGFYMHVLCYLLKSFKRYAVHTAIASCCHGSSCALIASRHSLTWYGAVLSSCIPCRCWHFASQPSGTQGRFKSRKIESGL